MIILRTLVCLTLMTAFGLPVMAAGGGQPKSSPGLGLSIDEEHYDWAQFSHMNQKKKTCFLRFVTEKELATIAHGVKPLEKRLIQKTKQLNIFCSR